MMVPNADDPPDPTSAPHLIPAHVFACLIPGELRIALFPQDGYGYITEWNIPIELVPSELRTPNTKLWIRVAHKERGFEILDIFRREEVADFE